MTNFHHGKSIPKIYSTDSHSPQYIINTYHQRFFNGFLSYSETCSKTHFFFKLSQSKFFFIFVLASLFSS